MNDVAIASRLYNAPISSPFEAAITKPDPTADLAAVFYDAPTTAAPPDQPTPDDGMTEDERRATQALYSREPEDAVPIQVPEAVKELRKGDSPLFDGRQAYSTAILIDDFQTTPEEGGNVAEIPDHVKTAAVQEYRAIFHDLGVAPTEAREVVTLARQLGKEPPTAELEADWVRQASQRLVDMNGGSIEEANTALSLAKALVQRDPRLKAVLELTRLGSHPRVIELMVQRARSEKMRGRL